METPIHETLSDVIKQVVYKKRNKKARKLFLQATTELKPDSCIVKIGWVSGKYISFNCYFEKNGNSEIFNEIEKGVENQNEIKSFIYGLNPKIFQFYPKMTFDEIKPNQLYLRFKLKRNVKIKG